MSADFILLSAEAENTTSLDLVLFKMQGVGLK